MTRTSWKETPGECFLWIRPWSIRNVPNHLVKDVRDAT